MRLCPRCDLELGDSAIACKCGWKDRAPRHSEPKLLIECAHDACQYRATVKVRVPTGYANLCPDHYADHYRKTALDTCGRLALHTTAQRREWATGSLDKLVAQWTPNYARTREPGDDDEPFSPSTTTAMQAILELHDDLPFNQA